jgi:hypothetical protein
LPGQGIPHRRFLGLLRQFSSAKRDSRATDERTTQVGRGGEVSE